MKEILSALSSLTLRELENLSVILEKTIKDKKESLLEEYGFPKKLSKPECSVDNQSNGYESLQSFFSSNM